MPNLSIIVPIYNVERYLSRCIESILNQEYKDFELILIDDGSPDNSAEIMESYAQKDNRVQTIHQKNMGVSAARNSGLRIARGKYVGFVDPDDYIDKAMYKQLIDGIEKNGADIACCNWQSFYGNGTIKKHEVNNVDRVMSQELFISHIFDFPRTVGGSNCNKLFFREKIVYLYDESLSICEDNLFLIQYCLGINKAYYINVDYYHIFEREDSAIRKEPYKTVIGLKARSNIVETVKKVSSHIKCLAEKDYLDSCYMFYCDLKNTNEKEYFSIACTHFREYMKENLWEVLCNKKIYWKTRIMYLFKFLTLIFEVESN